MTGYQFRRGEWPAARRRCGHRARRLAVALLPGGVSGVGGGRLGRVVRSRRAWRGALPTAM